MGRAGWASHRWARRCLTALLSSPMSGRLRPSRAPRDCLLLGGKRLGHQSGSQSPVGVGGAFGGGPSPQVGQDAGEGRLLRLPDPFVLGGAAGSERLRFSLQKHGGLWTWVGGEERTSPGSWKGEGKGAGKEGAGGGRDLSTHRDGIPKEIQGFPRLGREKGPDRGQEADGAPGKRRAPLGRRKREGERSTRVSRGLSCLCVFASVSVKAAFLLEASEFGIVRASFTAFTLARWRLDEFQ